MRMAEIKPQNSSRNSLRHGQKLVAMAGEEKQHVVLFPFMAQGHITPFLLLAELIRRIHPDLTITLVSTPLNIKHLLRSSLGPDSGIHLKPLPFHPSSHGLPPDAENMNALPVHRFMDFFRASETLQPAFEQLIADIAEEDGRPPLCIISDSFLAWTVSVARKFGASHSILQTASAYGAAILASLWRHLPHRLTESELFPLSDFPEICLDRSQLTIPLLAADGADVWSAFMRRQLDWCGKSDAMLVNTVEELEGRGLSMLRKVFDPVPVWPVGPLLRLSAENSNSQFTETDDLRQWLDSQPAASLLYVSFGSQNSITASQMMELAMALEASGRPFIWVIRPPFGFDVKGEFKPEWLPEGFEDRMGKTRQGFVVHKWAPQVEILSHCSTGGFLSHCGWNSVMESLIHGVPIVGWPLSAEQFYNSKFLEEVGVGVEVARGNRESSEVKKAVIQTGIDAVMGDEEMRRKAKESGELMRAALKEEGSSIRGLKEFLQMAISKKKCISKN